MEKCEGQVRAIVMVSGHVSLSCLSVWSMSVESSVTLFSRSLRQTPDVIEAVWQLRQIPRVRRYIMEINTGGMYSEVQLCSYVHCTLKLHCFYIRQCCVKRQGVEREWTGGGWGV